MKESREGRGDSRELIFTGAQGKGAGVTSGWGLLLLCSNSLGRVGCIIPNGEGQAGVLPL